MTVRFKTPHGQHDKAVERVMNRRVRRWTLLGTYGGGASAGSISWMVRHGKGIKAFEAYPAGTFEADIRNGNEVWFRRAR